MKLRSTTRASATLPRAWMRRELGQLSLADGLVEGGAGRNRQLEKIAALVDWAAFERLLGEIYAAPVGRPSSRHLPVASQRRNELRQP